MKLEIKKASGKARCRSLDCSRDEKFVSSMKIIKKNTICLCVKMPSSIQKYYYCRNCIDLLLIKFKSILNPEFWVLL